MKLMAELMSMDWQAHWEDIRKVQAEEKKKKDNLDNLKKSDSLSSVQSEIR